MSHNEDAMLFTLMVEPTIIETVKVAQMDDNCLRKLHDEVKQGKARDFSFVDGVLRLKDRLCVPRSTKIKQQILEQAHSSKFAIHPGCTKMYHDLREMFWWPSMKKDVARVEMGTHYNGFCHSLTTFELRKRYYLGSCRSSHQVSTFLSHEDHAQIDGQSERVIQILKDLLRLCTLDFKRSWEEHLPLVEFAYNNSYQASIKMAPFKALYRRKYRSPICWTEVGDGRLLGPQIVQEITKKIALIQQRIRIAQSHQKNYADKRRKDLEFSQGDHVFLKVSPSRGIICFRMKGKLNPRYIGPFEILERIGPVAYRLALPSELANVHNIFHFSCNSEDIHVPEIFRNSHTL
ncbi:uncharacterized protein LOC130776695 [Actinidia eriantha]|uniref:uncharacterized protein LOC130776695 n=1 Tax=Actinidia eriantha TaxID=165200 RepID=UPI00258F52A0|nr:uncharacterized protein LOC130776695 [Actinidia eriantha]